MLAEYALKVKGQKAFSYFLGANRSVSHSGRIHQCTNGEFLLLWLPVTTYFKPGLCANLLIDSWGNILHCSGTTCLVRDNACLPEPRRRQGPFPLLLSCGEERQLREIFSNTIMQRFLLRLRGSGNDIVGLRTKSEYVICYFRQHPLP